MNGKHPLAALALAAVLLPLLSAPGFGAAAVSPDKAADKTAASPDVLTVKGTDYSLTVRTPAGWKGDLEAAKPYHGNVLFTQAGDPAGGAKVLLIVQHKFDENTSLLINGDVANIRKQYPSLQTADLDVKHPRYPTFTKTLFQPGVFFQYEAYANPGSLYPYAVYVGMSKGKEAATPAELAAYQEIVGSLELAPPAAKPNPQ